MEVGASLWGLYNQMGEFGYSVTKPAAINIGSGVPVNITVNCAAEFCALPNSFFGLGRGKILPSLAGRASTEDERQG